MIKNHFGRTTGPVVNSLLLGGVRDREGNTLQGSFRLFPVNPLVRGFYSSVCPVGKSGVCIKVNSSTKGNIPDPSPLDRIVLKR